LSVYIDGLADAFMDQWDMSKPKRRYGCAIP
jgi:hypothetical protein